MWKKGFDTSYVGFMKDGAQWLVDNTDIKLVGKINNIYCSSLLIKRFLMGSNTQMNAYLLL